MRLLLVSMMTLLSSKPVAPPAEVRLPAHEETRLGNGMRLVIAPRTELPLVSVELLVESGAADDPAGKKGLASFTAGLMRRGTKSRSADEIDGAIEFVGGTLETGAGQDATVISASVTSEHLALALDIVGDVALNPSFPKEEFQVQKRRLVGLLTQALDDPGTVADRAMLGALLGAEHPYSLPSTGTRASVASFKLSDVRSAHARNFTPERATLFVVGDVAPRTVRKLVEEAFGGWEAKAPKRAAIPNPAPLEKNRIRIIHREQATQVQIRVVTTAFDSKTDPVFFPAVVANAAFGGGFTSRLVDEIRVNRGLSYSVGTRFTQLRGAGFFSFHSFTKNETVGELLQVLLAESERARSGGFTADEIARSKSYLSGLYPLRLETNGQIASALAEISLYGLPEDWVEAYRGRIVEADQPSIDRAAQEWFFARPFAVVLVGNERAIKKGLREAGIRGEIEVISIEEAP